jgi:hypothetical protein
VIHPEAQALTPGQSWRATETLVQSQAQDCVVQQSPTSQSLALSRPSQSISTGYFRNFGDHVIREDLVESTLRDIRRTIREYDDFVRGKDIEFTNVEDGKRLRVLDNFQPFMSLPEIHQEPYKKFRPQTSSLIIMWRSMFDVEHASQLRDKLFRLGPEVEELRFSPVFCGSMAYLLLHLVFYETDQLRRVEREAWSESLTGRMRPLLRLEIQC